MNKRNRKSKVMNLVDKIVRINYMKNVTNFYLHLQYHR